jgi:hypothetical protein
VYTSANKLSEPQPSILVSSNEYLFNLFESDIVLRVPNSDRSHVTIDIEVDGIHHKQKVKERFCTLRDKYLKSQGVWVFRIDANVLSKMKDKELQTWLAKSVKSARL